MGEGGEEAGHPTGCTLRLLINTAQGWQYEDGLGVAQEAIYNACHDGSGVCLLGSWKEPFAQTALGFLCTLGDEPATNGKVVCKNAFWNGYCTLQHKCKRV